MPPTPPSPLDRRLLLTPRSGLEWEGSGVSNPGVALLPNGQIAMLYRGCGSNNVGYFGYCTLSRDLEVVNGSRSAAPVPISQPSAWEEFPDGFGDPRINLIDGKYYIWANGRRNAEARQARERFGNDFRHQYMGGRQTVGFVTQDFEALDYLGLVGPDQYDKNSFLLPSPLATLEGDRLVFFHRIQFSVQMRTISTIGELTSRIGWRRHMDELDECVLLKPEFAWEGVGLVPGWPGSVAGGAPPVRLPVDTCSHFGFPLESWLLFYNASGVPRNGRIARDRRVGVVVLSANPDLHSRRQQPVIVMARSHEPILAASFSCEFDTPNGDVVFCTGALLSEDSEYVHLFLGSGDVCVSTATFQLSQLLGYLAEMGHCA